MLPGNRGLWVVSFLFMFVLHLTITIITYFNTGGVMPGYLAASLLCSLNVLFMVLMVSLLSLVLHDFAAAFLSVGIVAISFISDTIDKVAHSDSLNRQWRLQMNICLFGGLCGRRSARCSLRGVFDRQVNNPIKSARCIRQSTYSFVSSLSRSRLSGGLKRKNYEDPLF